VSYAPTITVAVP